MDALSRRSLVTAAVRELASLAAALPAEAAHATSGGCRGDTRAKLRQALADVAEARASLERVAGALSTDSDSAGAGAGRDDGDGAAALGQAQGLRVEATSAREDAEATWRALRAERAGLLGRLRELRDEQQEAHEASQRAEDEANDREKELLQECATIEAQTRGARDFLQSLSGNLADKGHLGVLLSRRRRTVQHQHATSASQSEGSREILHIEESTNLHVSEVFATCGKLEHELALAHRRSGERSEELRSEWTEQQAHFKSEELALGARLAELRTEYAEKWEVAERDARKRVQEKAAAATEARAVLTRQLTELDAERESEAVVRRERLEEQQEFLCEAREQAVCELQTRLGERQQQIQERVDAERERCGKLRGQQLRRLDDLTREVGEFRSNIEKVRDNYRTQQTGRQTCSPELPSILPTPRSVSSHPLSSRAALGTF